MALLPAWLTSLCSCQALMAGFWRAAPPLTQVAACSKIWHQAVLLPGYQSSAVSMQHPANNVAAILTFQSLTLLHQDPRAGPQTDAVAAVRHTAACWTKIPDTSCGLTRHMAAVGGSRTGARLETYRGRIQLELVLEQVSDCQSGQAQDALHKVNCRQNVQQLCAGAPTMRDETGTLC